MSCANRSKSALILLLFIVLGGWGGPWGLAQAEPVLVDPQAERSDLSDRMALRRDPERRLRFPEILALRAEFAPVKRQALVTSFNAGAYWLHLSLVHRGTQPLTRWLVVGTAKTPRVALYEPEPGGEGWRVSQSGRGVARQDKPVVALDPLFPVTLMPGEARELWLRVDVSGATDMATILWDPLAYREASGRQQMWQAGVIGGMLLSTFLALLAFAHLREAQYFWLALMLIGVVGLEVARENLLGTYVWPAQFAPPPQLLAGFALIALFGESKLAAHALGLAPAWPAADRLLRLLRWSAVAGALLALFSYGQGVRVLSITALVLHGAMITLAVLVWRRGQRMARVFLFAFSLALLTETARQLANLGLLPWIAAMNFSLFFYLLASPFILLGLIEQTRELQQRLQLASQLERAKSDFLARVSHELRSPLNTILGFNRMLARRSARLSLAEGTGGIEKSVLRLLALIDELLDEARTATGMLVVRPAPLALRPWLEEIAQAARLTSQARGNKLISAFSGERSLRIEADGERLRQVLENLLNNANRHTERGQIRFACAARTEGGQAQVDFVVEDTGEGMDAGELALIFEPFIRGESPGASVSREGAGRGTGFGLGLSICRELVRQMGSDITVTSAPGQGSRFSFSLRCPLVMEEGLARGDGGDARASDVPPGETLEGPTNPGWPRPKVPVVEDDPLQLDTLTRLLVDAGGARGGRDGLAALATLASEGDISGIEDWIAARRALAPDQERILGWVEERLHRLDLALLERLATRAASIQEDRR